MLSVKGRIEMIIGKVIDNNNMERDWVVFQGGLVALVLCLLPVSICSASPGFSFAPQFEQKR